MGILETAALAVLGGPVGLPLAAAKTFSDVVGDQLGPLALNASDQAADIEAINKFFLDTKAVNSTATNLKNEWLQWYSGLGWYDKNVNEAIAAQAFNKRNAFLRANVTTSAEKEMVDRFIKDVDGPTTNPVTGKPILKDDQGNRIVPPIPLIPPLYKAIAVGVGTGTVVLVVLKKLRIL